MSTYSGDYEDDYNFNMLLANTTISYLPSAMDQQRVRRWLERLRRYNRTEEQMLERNTLIYHLAMNLHEAKLRPPFTDNPPAGPLHAVMYMLPSIALDTDEEDGRKPWWEAIETDDLHRDHKPFVYEKSPDGGTFLSMQPVPRCGVFCYLAIVAKDKDADKN